MKQITDGVYQFQGMAAGGVYLITDGDGLTLVDTGMPNAPNQIIRQMKRAGYAPTDIKRILITHSHMDHIGGLAKLKTISGAEVIASAAEKPDIEQVIAVDRVVNDGDILGEVMGGLQVIATPGHSAGHTVYWQPDRRILFIGDALMNWFGRLSMPFEKPTLDMEQAKESARQIAALEPSIVCFGHGPALTENTAAEITAFAAHRL
ncbi:MAG: MBL fold metallo-hydrolase [Anaerolineae bacterium]|nr:MBL fold metallo-hydrolase [Anaerolineae bacterium]